MVFADGTFGHTGTIENTHAMVLRPSRRRDVVGARQRRVPMDTGNLRQIFDEAMARGRRVIAAAIARRGRGQCVQRPTSWRGELTDPRGDIS